MSVVAVSGGFDPVHIGHLRLLKDAKALGDKLVVILNNDNWLKAKKGFTFMAEDERKAILEAIRYVDEVIISEHPEQPEDMSICNELQKLKPDIFANGGDRDQLDADNNKSSLNPEQHLCQQLKIKMVYNVGGAKAQSSSDLVKRIRSINPDK